MMLPGGKQTVWSLRVASGTKEIDCSGYNALLLFHDVVSGTAYATVRVKTDSSGFAVGHHTDGTNIKTSNQTADYCSLFKGIARYNDIILNYAGGTHNIYAVPTIY